MQEVLLKSVPHLPKFDSPRALVVWLYKVAKDRCLMSRGSKFAPNRELSLEELMPDRRELEKLSAESGINPERFAIRSEETGMLREAIQKLPAQYRIVLVLRDMEIQRRIHCVQGTGPLRFAGRRGISWVGARSTKSS